jgi:uncharacterized 2Fe-2S/4Fe-4S cluster protein (DUF4445 family)
MAKCLVIFHPEGRVVEVERGSRLLDAAHAAGVVVDSPCGGEGNCGRCRVRIRHGEINAPPTTHLTPRQMRAGYCLACQATVAGDLVVEVPVESQLATFQVLTHEPGLEEAAAIAAAKKLLGPLTTKRYREIPAPSVVDHVSDLQRLRRALGWADGATHLDPDLSQLRGLGGVFRKADWKVTATTTDEPCPRLLEIEPGNRADSNYGVAIDVGTSTVVAQLVDMTTGDLLAAATAYNAQLRFGEDVISRIIYTSENPRGLEELRGAVLGTANRLIGQLVEEAEIAAADITAVACAGNTTMTHILLGLDPRTIRREPFVPLASALDPVPAAEVGFQVNPHAIAYFCPAISGFVGGDISAGVVAMGVGERRELTLLIDIGTNGEVVLGNREWLMSCSCSAGPAFEGSGIQYGMHATAGAIERVTIDLAHDRVEFRTIGGGRPRGLCGSGLVDALAEMRRNGVIDRAGNLNLALDSPRVREGLDGPEFVLVWGEEVGREDDIVLRAADIENLLRSKAAVFAGTRVLLRSVGLEMAAVERVFVAGGFGNFLSVDKAILIGLLPDLPLERFRFVGNASLTGARLALLSDEARRRLRRDAQRITYCELSVEPAFMDEYVSALFLPHTDLTLFPNASRQLKT